MAVRSFQIEQSGSPSYLAAVRPVREEEDIREFPSVGPLEAQDPLRIAGAWDNPDIEVTGKDQISEAIRQIGKNLKSEDVQDAIKGLLGGGEGKRVKPRELLEKLLGK